MKSVVATILLLCSTTMTNLHAEVNKFTSVEVFSPDAVHFIFLEYLERAKANEALSAWGVTFAVEDHSRLEFEIRIFFPSDIISPIPCLCPVVRNRSGGPLIINFKYPVRRAGLWLAGGPDTIVTIEGFTNSGRSLGAVQHEGLTGEKDPPTLVGIEIEEFAGVEDGIAKLSVSFSDPAGADGIEELDQLSVEFMSRPTFATFLAQIADGRLGDGSQSVRTLVTIVNPHPGEAEGKLSFRASDGTPLSLGTQVGEANQFDFTVPPRTSRTFVTDGSRIPAASGYARIDSNVPVNGTEAFRVTDVASGQLIAEVGVGSDEGKVLASGGVLRSSGEGIDTAIALVNTSEGPAVVILQLSDETGEAAIPEITVELGPGEHRARFVDELFENLVPSEFTGAVRIRASAPIVILILRTVDGMATSSLPVASLQQ